MAPNLAQVGVSCTFMGIGVISQHKPALRPFDSQVGGREGHRVQGATSFDRKPLTQVTLGSLLPRDSQVTPQ